VHDEARVLAQPSLYLGVVVRGVVVYNQMQRQALGRLAVDQTQELQPLLVAVPRLAHRDHAAVQCVQGGEQRRRAVALVVVGDGTRAAGLHR
jgi:hypothetical protein